MQYFDSDSSESTQATWLIWSFVITALCGLLVSCIPNGDTTGASASPADLHSLELSAGSLQPLFASTIPSYTVLAPNAAASTTVTAITADPTAKLVINNQPAVSGRAFGPIALDPDLTRSTTITIVVEPPGSALPKSYTINVARAGNADLKSLAVSPGTLTPIFNPDTLSYTVTLTTITSSVAVTAAVQEPTSTLTINGVAVPSAQAHLVTGLQEVANPVTVRVRTSAGATQDYLITVLVPGPPPTDATLAAVNITGDVGDVLRELKLCPILNATDSNYSVTPVPSSTDGVWVKATPRNASATLTINGQAVAADTEVEVPLTLTGNNKILIVVTPPAGKARTYTFTVNRASGIFFLSSNNYLWALTASAAALSPEFCHNVTTYTGTTTLDTTSVTATLADPSASLQINGAKATSGVPSAPILLAKGKKTAIPVVVTALSGAKQTYSIEISRP